MSSHWIRVGPDPMIGGFYKMKKQTQRHIGEKAMEAEDEVMHYKPRNTKDCQ